MVNVNVKSDYQARAWCFTSYDENEVGSIKTNAGIVAMVVGKEICPTTRKEHYQGYIRFENNKRFSWWKNQYPTLHVEPRKGNEAQAAEYCRKEGNVIIDFGCAAKVKRDQENVTEAVLDLLDAGAPLWQVRKRSRLFFFHNASKIRSYKEQVDAERDQGIDPADYGRE